ncbi:MAG: YebC/PmpR family DNA-binding transcriptional regulator [Flavobacteriales bacterium]
MAGHSKWANIKHRKGAQDAKKSKIFNRMSKEIMVAARDGGEDPEANPALRTAIQNAKGVNLPKDRIEKAIKKGVGDEGENLMSLTYEGYGPGGIAFFVEATTDNQNRAVSNIRSIFTKYGGSLGKNGSVEHLFDKKGVFTIEKGQISSFDKEELEMDLIDSGAEDVVDEEEIYVIYTDFQDFGMMQKKLDELKIEPKNSELQRIPKATTKVDTDTGKRVLKMIDAFENSDEVNNVFHNLELTEELYKMLL